MTLKYDGTINAGHLMTAATILASVVGAVVYVQADLRRLESDQARIQTTFAAELVSIRSDASARESRLRTAELAIAGQASDLRAIQASLARIERLLEGNALGR